MQWKEITRDGHPKSEGRYLIARSTSDSVSVKLFLFEDHFTGPVKYWCEIPELPKPDAK